MGLLSWIKGMFSSWDKPSPSSDESFEELSAPAPPGIGGVGVPSEATMVLSTVPSYTAWLVVRKGANQRSYLLYDMGSSNRSWRLPSTWSIIPS